MSDKTTKTTGTAKRGRKTARDAGRVSAIVGTETYDKLDEIRWDARVNSVDELGALIVAAWVRDYEAGAAPSL